MEIPDVASRRKRCELLALSKEVIPGAAVGGCLSITYIAVCERRPISEMPCNALRQILACYKSRCVEDYSYAWRAS